MRVNPSEPIVWLRRNATRTWARGARVDRAEGLGTTRRSGAPVKMCGGPSRWLLKNGAPVESLAPLVPCRMRRSARSNLLAVLGLAASLPACHLGPPRRPEVPREATACGKLLVTANAACERVAARCTSFAACYDALDDLRDVPGHFPGKEPCDRQIAARMLEATAADVPRLLAGIDRGGFHKRELALRVLADGNAEIVRVLLADSSPAATLALAARAALHPDVSDDFRSREHGAAAVERHMARGSFSSPDRNGWSFYGRGWSEPVRPASVDPLSTHVFAHLLGRSLFHESLPPCPAGGGQEKDPLSLSPRCRPPMLPGLELPAVARDSYGRYGTKPFRTLPCEREEKGQGAPWFYRRGEKRSVSAPDRRTWLPRVTGYSTGRSRGILCTNVPSFAPIELASGTLHVVQGDLVMDRPDGTYALEGFAFAGARTSKDEALLVEGLFSGDTWYRPEPVVFLFDGATGRRQEVASLPGEEVDWISLEPDGVLLVATSEFDRRYVSEVTAAGGKPLPCW